MPDMTGGMLKTRCLDGKSCCIKPCCSSILVACYCCVMHLETVSVSMRENCFLPTLNCMYYFCACLLGMTLLLCEQHVWVLQLTDDTQVIIVGTDQVYWLVNAASFAQQQALLQPQQRSLKRSATAAGLDNIRTTNATGGHACYMHKPSAIGHVWCIHFHLSVTSSAT